MYIQMLGTITSTIDMVLIYTMVVTEDQKTQKTSNLNLSRGSLVAIFDLLHVSHLELLLEFKSIF